MLHESSLCYFQLREESSNEKNDDDCECWPNVNHIVCRLPKCKSENKRIGSAAIGVAGGAVGKGLGGGCWLQDWALRLVAGVAANKRCRYGKNTLETLRLVAFVGLRLWVIAGPGWRSCEVLR